LADDTVKAILGIDQTTPGSDRIKASGVDLFVESEHRYLGVVFLRSWGLLVCAERKESMNVGRITSV
jgi:hypothetical protein